MAEKYKEKNKDKKPGYFQRMMEQAQEQQRAQTKASSEEREKRDGMSKSERSEYDSAKIREARKRLAEKYGEEYVESDDSEPDGNKPKNKK